MMITRRLGKILPRYSIAEHRGFFVRRILPQNRRKINYIAENLALTKENDIKNFAINGKKALDLVCSYLSNPHNREVFPKCKPNFMKKMMSKRANRKPESFSQIFAELEEKILPNMLRIDSSGHLSWFPTMNGYYAMPSNMIVNSFINPCSHYKYSVSTLLLENKITQWFMDFFDLPNNFRQKESGAVIYYNVSMCTVSAALAAKRIAMKKHPNKLNKLKYYCSTEAHYSIKKAAKVCGFQAEQIPVKYCKKTQNFVLDVNILEKKLHEDSKNGYVIASIAITLGTTGTTGLDDADKIGSLAKKYGAWFHIDAAYCANALILPEYRWILKGVEKADSFCFNSVKMFPIHHTSICYFSNIKNALSAYEVDSHYFSHGDEIDHTKLEFANSRVNKALRLYTYFQGVGLNSLKKVARKLFDCAKIAEDRLNKDPRFEVILPCKFALINFTLKNKSNKDILAFSEHINKRGKLFMGPYTIKLEGKDLTIMRLSVNWFYSTPEVINDQIDEIIAAYDEIFEEEENLKNIELAY